MKVLIVLLVFSAIFGIVSASALNSCKFCVDVMGKIKAEMNKGYGLAQSSDLACQQVNADVFMDCRIFVNQFNHMLQEILNNPEGFRHSPFELCKGLAKC